MFEQETTLTRTKDYPLHSMLKRFFGFDSFKGHQEDIIKNLLSGKNTFVIMPTGGGKSLCYQLPALIKDGTAIIISPLIALMKNQVDAMRGFSSDSGMCGAVTVIFSSPTSLMRPRWSSTDT